MMWVCWHTVERILIHEAFGLPFVCLSRHSSYQLLFFTSLSKNKSVIPQHVVLLLWFITMYKKILNETLEVLSSSIKKNIVQITWSDEKLKKITKYSTPLHYCSIYQGLSTQRRNHHRFKYQTAGNAYSLCNTFKYLSHWANIFFLNIVLSFQIQLMVLSNRVQDETISKKKVNIVVEWCLVVWLQQRIPKDLILVLTLQAIN